MQHKVITRSRIPSSNIARATAMCTCPSRAEEALWQGLRRGQLGVRFIRQACIGRFIVDFLAPVACLVVEVDGAYHLHTKRADKSRTRKLNRSGYRVLRVSRCWKRWSGFELSSFDYGAGHMITTLRERAGQARVGQFLVAASGSG